MQTPIPLTWFCVDNTNLHPLVSVSHAFVELITCRTQCESLAHFIIQYVVVLVAASPLYSVCLLAFVCAPRQCRLPTVFRCDGCHTTPLQTFHIECLATHAGATAAIFVSDFTHNTCCSCFQIAIRCKCSCRLCLLTPKTFFVGWRIIG